jgi:hypothetical protein
MPPFDKDLFDELKRKEAQLVRDRGKIIELLGIVRLRIQEIVSPIIQNEKPKHGK